MQPAAGTRADQYLGLASGEHVVAIVPVTGEIIALGTAQGTVKRVATSELAPGKHEAEIIALKPGDRVIGAGLAPDDVELVFVTSDAQLLRFGADAVRPQGRAAGGMAGIRLSPGAEVIAFAPVAGDERTVVVTVAEGSFAARSEGPVAEDAPAPSAPGVRILADGLTEDQIAAITVAVGRSRRHTPRPRR